MPSAEEFDEFYVSSRRRLVVQTFALTGDLGVARTAVRDAYVGARHHWDKVGRLADPEGWVRPRAWASAQRRHTVRPWHKEKSLTAEQTATLSSLADLTDDQRRVLVLHHLAGLDLPEVGRELGLTGERTAAALVEGSAALAEAMDAPADAVPSRLADLDAVAATVKLPRASIVRRSGARRRRNHALVGSALVALLTVGAGAFVEAGTPSAAVRQPGVFVGQRMLLGTKHLTTLAPNRTWTVKATTDNTGGTGLNTPCQTSRFADDVGLGTLVRTFTAAGRPTRKFVQTVEISNSPGAARDAYATTVGWYAGCGVARVRLVDAYDVNGVGDRAQVLRLRIPGAPDRSLVVAIARTGSLTVTTVLETGTDRPAAAAPVAKVLGNAVTKLCESRVAGDCTTAVSVVDALPPRSGDEPGMLAVVDLPAIPGVAKPWVGTDPVQATVNPAATTCERADFIKAGAQQPLTRTFLVPTAKLPKRFGLTETIGTFPSAKAANTFAQQIIERMRTCSDRELGSKLPVSQIERNGPRKTLVAMWRLENQLNRSEEVLFWTGIVRSGTYVAQVTLTPIGDYDFEPAVFQALLNRSRDRLFEVD